MYLSKQIIFSLLLAIGAALISILQLFGVSPDYLNYDLFFEQLRSNHSYQLTESRFEFGFLYSSYFLTLIFSENNLIFGFFVFVASWFKFYFAGKFSPKGFLWLVLIFYFFKFFPLLELNQLRAALASSFLVAVFYYNSIKRYKLASVLVILAILFHNSAALLVPFIFIPDKLITQSKIFIISIVVYLTCYFTSYLLVPFMANHIAVFDTYLDGGLESSRRHAVSPVFFAEFLMIGLSLILWNNLTQLMKKVLAIEIIGFSIFYGYIDLNIVAVRGREFFSIFWILYIVQFPYVVKKVKISILVFIFGSTAIAFYTYFYLDFFMTKF